MKPTIAQFLNVKEFPFKIHDSNGNKLYYENSYGTWCRQEFDSNGNKIYYEDSNGLWYKEEFDSNNNLIYFENSNGTVRHYPLLENKVVEIEGVKYKLNKL